MRQAWLRRARASALARVAPQLAALAAGALLFAHVTPLSARWLAQRPLITDVELTRPSSVALLAVPSPPVQRIEAAEPAPVCDAAPRALLRAGCPDSAPEVSACGAEGLECRYETDAGCVAHFECVYGLWSPIGVDCPAEDPGRSLTGSGTCEGQTPVADAPCTDEGLSCAHQPCGYAEAEALVAECRCGRWYQRWQGCPLVR